MRLAAAEGEPACLAMDLALPEFLRDVNPIRRAMSVVADSTLSHPTGRAVANALGVKPRALTVPNLTSKEQVAAMVAISSGDLVKVVLSMLLGEEKHAA